MFFKKRISRLITEEMIEEVISNIKMLYVKVISQFQNKS